MLKQYVPSSVCLKCDGCCRFQVADSPWRPKASGDFTDDNHYITTIKEAGKHLCRFLNKVDNTCRVYDKRPFECALYPFLLSRSSKGLEVYLHLACPFVQEKLYDPLTKEYISHLKEYFQSPQVMAVLKQQAHLIGDYSPFIQEIQHVLTLQDTL